MKKAQRKLTKQQRRENAIRAACIGVGFRRGYKNAERYYRATLDELTDRSDEIYRATKARALFDAKIEPQLQYEHGCRDGRSAGFEAGMLVGEENATVKLREFYERQRRAAPNWPREQGIFHSYMEGVA